MKVELGFASAVSVTVLAVAKDAAQVDPQSTPIGLLVTRPAPEPIFSIVKSDWLTGGANAAVTD